MKYNANVNGSIFVSQIQEIIQRCWDRNELKDQLGQWRERLIILHRGVSLELLLKRVPVFGSRIYSSLHASASVGVDIEAEQRFGFFLLFYLGLGASGNVAVKLGISRISNLVMWSMLAN
ncbi:transducin/WD40 repeat-like superfamily protein [Artemisia annua]|uniref:Transducin/WD40 repeat-like superfamily protein n=1 Tax=Artemisia annua TaxID=35608 RepID=A0A2U1NVA9_ARTAN|nr:transducin/WD40 repeat-like superfamily protein [Artemisia annua]